jgi:hypothetical protein
MSRNSCVRAAASRSWLTRLTLVTLKDESKTIALWAMMKLIAYRKINNYAEPCPELLSELLESQCSSVFVEVQQVCFVDNHQQ